MSFSSFMNKAPKVIPLFQELGQKDVLEVEKGDKGFKLVFHWERIDLRKAAIIRKTCENDSAGIEAFLTSQMLGKGPKIFRPSGIDLESLEQMTLSIGMDDYTQPFQTVILELPENYTRNKIVKNPQGGTDSRTHGIWCENHSPDMLGIYSTKDIIVSAVYLSSGQAYTITLINNSELTLAEIVDKSEEKSKGESLINCMESSQEESSTCFNVLRAGLNYCLLLEEIGIKKVGPQNPSHYERLHRFKKNREQTALEIQRHPMIYEFAQKVRLFKRESTFTNNNSNHNGITVKPHWRRGYWRMQAHGPEFSLRKRIRIEPVLVNAHLFAGELVNTSVIYE